MKLFDLVGWDEQGQGKDMDMDMDVEHHDMGFCNAESF